MKKYYKSAKVALLIFAATLTCLTGAKAQDAASLYKEAKASYLKQRNQPAEKTTEKAWLEVYKAFEAVYEGYPTSSEAPKALYMTGKVAFRMPDKFRSEKVYLNTIENLHTLADKFPESTLVDDSLFMCAELYMKLDDQPRAKREILTMLEKYPDGDMATTATEWLVKLKDVEPAKDETELDKPDKESKNDEDKKTTELTVITKAWYTSTEAYTRVVVYASKKVEFSKLTFLEGNIETGSPPRLYLDIMNSKVDKELKRTVPISDGILEQVRIGQFTEDKVRVVLDIESVDREHTKIFPQHTDEGDFKIIIDVTGGNSSAKLPEPEIKDPDTLDAIVARIPEPEPEGKEGNKDKYIVPGNKNNYVNEQETPQFKRIVIDAGHGGFDPGAVGPDGVKEKDITLAIALKLEKDLKKELGVEVFLTRRTDKYLPLEERTAFANAKKADIFISIHANSAKRAEAKGVETYYLNATTDRAAIRLSALENKTTESNISDFQEDYKLIILDLLQTSKAEDSSRLAGFVQDGIVSGLKTKHKDTKNLGVKHALFFVLMGAKMPSVLVETSFISNKKEEKLLVKPSYQQMISNGITKGVKKFIAEQQKGPVATL